MQSELFKPRQLIVLIAVGALAMLGAAYLMIFAAPGGGDAAGVNAFSSSAIGHAAFVEMLTRSGLSVHISRGHSLEKAQGQTLLVLAEPADDDLGHQMLQARQAATILVVLPKRMGTADPAHPAWLASSSLINTDILNKLLNDIDPHAYLGRSTGTLQLAATADGLKANLPDPQLIFSTAIRPVIARPKNEGGGTLLGRIEASGTVIWILSDPDLIATHGLRRGDNAEVALRVVRMALPTGGTVLVDETIHGFLQEANLLKNLLHLPLLVASIAFALAVMVLFIASAFRFGGAAKMETALAAGKLTLITNAAALLAVGDRRLPLTDRYLRVVFAELARRLGQSKPLDEAGLITWLDQQANRRGLSLTASHILAANSSRKSTAALMRQVETWTREMTNGVPG